MYYIKYEPSKISSFSYVRWLTACGKTEFLLRLLETIYKSHFEFIVILCPTILDNKTYLSRKWIFDDNNVFVVCDIEGKLNEWIK